ncbi:MULTISPECIES: MerR family transcriptional regulator [Lentilactobacillus]|jgi:hypothetical protein|uniref:DNA-binding protein n=1 Tax=Lentilactobacillus TaxID=2767893 RepID=UPI00129293F6|nr:MULTISPECIES: DNA-binding protein [Lentilactobacillus]MCI1922825.1 helix-turn-helix domain-containing protein [Lentilactobacillus buchneri]MCI1950435.1 helix-turn-helix domain-containing protein [Lentilactobacillus buchneri]MCI2018584.1 helix-turn-helix domain-containing protein [Lentilactobacillus buchneri]MCI2027605.1 helix-turn-helix domain-containing protein [Lentilactobacillus buchneri]MCP9331894.1 DNA-binding protein [Lentilactobacillus hilgardii]
MTTKAAIKPAVHSVPETARIVKTSTDNVYDLIKMGYIKPMILGAKMISNIEIDRFLDKYAGVDLKSQIVAYRADPLNWRKRI